MIWPMSFFRMLPEAILDDVLSGKLKHTDLTLYFSLCRKSFNGKEFFLNIDELAKEIKCHPNTVRSSLKRLRKSGHISQTRSWRGYFTKLETIVKDSKTYIKGELHQ
jgi:DNA-binding transcriptional regulator YhcF (GntR family)|tara:strand:- start:358 stop:678 length:321 start_codon:yes stop_codon:yes gene_type:complete